MIVARKAFNQAGDAARAARRDGSAPWHARPVAPPLTPLQELRADAGDRIARHCDRTTGRSAAAEPVAPVAEDQNAAPQAAATGGPAATPPPLPQTQPGFEERIGTRWVVWVGGLTLALGGFFMVRYSIEAGLLGPGVRTLLGGAFALALLAAGEWTRRKESISAIEALPIANIPAILTAAGTAVAFATVYAAYALYGFLVPATAFVLLGLVALGTLAAALLHGPALAGLGIAAAFVTPILVSSDKPDYWALYIYLAIVTAAAFGAGADQAVALARGHHHRAGAALDLPLPAMRAVDGRTARIPRRRGVCARRTAGGVRIHVRPAGRRRPDRADLVGFARGLSAWAQR